MDGFKAKVKAVIRDGIKGGTQKITNPYEADRSIIIKECKTFSRSPVDVIECRKLITQLLWMYSRGEIIENSDLTDIFFGITKLFQSDDLKLRKMVYVVLKEIQPRDTEAFIVTSCLLKDVQSDKLMHRVNAYHTLANFVDEQLVGSLERHLKIALAHTSGISQSAALTATLRIMEISPELAKNIMNEIQEIASMNIGSHSQFIALGVVYKMKKNDGVAIHRIITQIKANLLSLHPLSSILLIRICYHMLLNIQRSMEIKHPALRTTLGILDSFLKHSHQSVAFEAADCICQLSENEAVKLSIPNNGSSNDTRPQFGFQGNDAIFDGLYDISSAVNTLRNLLRSEKISARFSSMSSLNKLAKINPKLVSNCDKDLEKLLDDPSILVSITALAGLLNTATEERIDRLISRVECLIKDMGDSYKFDVIDAVYSLIKRFPSKYEILIGFLSKNMQGDGGLEVKKRLVRVMMSIICDIRDGRIEIPFIRNPMDACLYQLSEFVEDCEYDEISIDILEFISANTRWYRMPERLLGILYNRLLLERASVRAAAVHALGNLAHLIPRLKTNVVSILKESRFDNDPEISDRVKLLLKDLSMPPPDDSRVSRPSVFDEDPDFCCMSLFDQMCDFMSTSDSECVEFDASNVLSVEEYSRIHQSIRQKGKPRNEPIVPDLGNYPNTDTEQTSPDDCDFDLDGLIKRSTRDGIHDKRILRRYEEYLTEYLSDTHLGRIKIITIPQATNISGEDAEYSVSVSKIITENGFVILLFHVKNNLPDVTLKNISIILGEPKGVMWEIQQLKEISMLNYCEEGIGLVTIQRMGLATPARGFCGIGSLKCQLSFELSEDYSCSYQDVYPLKDVDITIGDYCTRNALADGHFKASWESENVGYSSLDCKCMKRWRSLEMGVTRLQDIFNMEFVDGTSRISLSGAYHTLHMSGYFLNTAVLMKSMIGYDPGRGFLMKATIKCVSEDICQFIANEINVCH